MCGRYFFQIDEDQIVDRYQLEDVYLENYDKGEIFPTNNVPIIINNLTKKAVVCKWKYPVKGIKNITINAKLETIAEKISFKQSFLNRRCIIPANAFFEWKHEGSNKIKYKVSVKDEPIFSMAGIYNVFSDESNKPYLGFVIITKEADEMMSKLHHRMPLIINPEYESLWLDSKLNTKSELNMVISSVLQKDADLILNELSDNQKYVQLSF